MSEKVVKLYGLIVFLDLINTRILDHVNTLCYIHIYLVRAPTFSFSNKHVIKSYVLVESVV